MALFPAYSSSRQDIEHVAEELSSEQSDASPARGAEAQLLASDDDDAEPARKLRRAASPADFYLDRRLDRGNLRVSTLYYPGRPEYCCAAAPRAARPARARYYSRRAPDAPAAPALHERVVAFRRLLAAAPDDVALWESFIDFQDACGGADGALAAAEEGAARLPRAHRLRARLLAALRRALPPHAALERLRDMLAAERAAPARVELWEALLRALAAAPGGDAAQLDAAAAAALADTRALPAAYPRLLLARGELLRAAGLAERLALLVELVVAMNFAPDAAAPFPPPALRAELERAERRVREPEDAALRSGLPLGAVWVRVERLRGAAHWRAPPAAAAEADPQRAPLPHDVADLLLPASAPAELLRLAATLLLLAGVPALPGAGWMARWAGGAAHGAEALLPLLGEAGALPAAHRAHVAPADARRVLLLLQDPPHYFTDDAGYLRWVEALWDALCARLRGDALLALACWRLRWLAALLPLAAPAEAARLRGRARALLRSLDHPLPFAEFARLERGAAGPARAAAAAAAALRAALPRADVPHHHCLYIARLLAELSADGARPGAAGACALVSAALRRAPPAGLPAPAPADLAAALHECERRCAALEAAADEEEDVAGALLPGAGEWARARALLAGPRRREQLLRRLAAAARAGGAARYWEESGAALAGAAAREGRAGAAARELLPLFPHNVYLALGESRMPQHECRLLL
ncbi:uncharacterized protein [Maniola hyperantus]|uniref:uncharacterized protein n=1 Tax=Aphantopus hyperantus TaxID=2795564 RepID=UPI003747A75C